MIAPPQSFQLGLDALLGLSVWGNPGFCNLVGCPLTRKLKSHRLNDRQSAQLPLVRSVSAIYRTDALIDTPVSHQRCDA